MDLFKPFSVFFSVALFFGWLEKRCCEAID